MVERSATAENGAQKPANSDRAQSETIGVLLLTGVVIISVGAIGFFVLSGTGDNQGPVTSVAIDVDTKNVTLAHDGGTVLPESEVVVIIDGASRERFQLENLDAVSEDGDGRFEPGEQWRKGHNVSAGGAVEVLVIHEPSGEVLRDERKQVPEEG